MAINEDVIYEVNDKGERVVVKSDNSARVAHLRFTNRTSRPVNIWWRDFSGIKKHYQRVDPGLFYDVTSYLTHPWEFSDASTNESFVINNKCIFRAPNSVGGMMHRTNWNISVPMRSLRRTTMLTLASLIPNPEAAMGLNLPRALATELSELVNTIHTTPAIVVP